MRKCRIIKTETNEDGSVTETVLFQSVQRPKLQLLLSNMLARGEDARLECDPPHKKRVRINSITGKPRK